MEESGSDSVRDVIGVSGPLFPLTHSLPSLISLPQVWSLEQPDWHCKIDEGSIGLVSSRWSPDGRHILNTTEFHVSVKLERAYTHVHASDFMLSGFNCCWPVRKGGPENSRTPEPFLNARTLPPHLLHVFSLISLLHSC